MLWYLLLYCVCLVMMPRSQGSKAVDVLDALLQPSRLQTHSFVKHWVDVPEQQHAVLPPVQSLDQEESVGLHSTVKRWKNIDIKKQSAKQSYSLLAFISITSGPLHYDLRQSARATWLLPCIASPLCQYKFFVDAPPGNITIELKHEQMEYHDLVYRNACPYMLERHPFYINYGNSQVVDIGVDEAPLHQDYPLRRIYKIDWKICFLKWQKENKYKTDLHIFVEDDSFVCTENLLYQAALLRQVEPAKQDKEGVQSNKIPALRTGTPMYDGFDDSSTIMSASIGDAFVANYNVVNSLQSITTAKLFNCSKVIDDMKYDAKLESDSIWMSWGNSWMNRLCNWKDVLETVVPSIKPIHEPYMDCLTGIKFSRPNGENSVVQVHSRLDEHTLRPDLNASISFQPDDKNSSTVPLKFPCQPNRPLVYHGKEAQKHLFRDQSQDRIGHMCEYMLLIDKVKEPSENYMLWNTATETDFQDFSPVFIKDKELGWLDVLQAYEEAEALACQSGVHSNPDICAKVNRRYKRHLRHTKDDPKRVLQERNDRRRQRMQNAAKIIYGDKTEAYEHHASREGSLHASSRYRIYYEGSLLSMD
jgi:hypothetical protein